MNQNPENRNNENFDSSKGENQGKVPYGFGKPFSEGQNADQAQRPVMLNGQPMNSDGQQPFNTNGQPFGHPPFNSNGQPFGQQPFNPNGQPFGQPPYGAYTPYNEPPKKKGTGMSIAGFVISIVALFSCCSSVVYIIFPLIILGLIFSAVGIASSKKSGKTNGLAIAGLVISIVHLVFWILAIAAVLALGLEFFEEFISTYSDYATNI